MRLTVRGLKGQKMAQNDKTFCLSHSVSQEPYIIWLFFGTHVYQIVHMCTDDYDYISSNFFSFLEISIFGAKNDLKLPISVFFALYLRSCRPYHQDFVNDIYKCFFFIFSKKNAAL